MGAAPKEKEQKGRTVVLAVDESPASQSAVRWAADMVLLPSDVLHMVSVLEPATRPDFSAAGEAVWPLGDPDVCTADPEKLERACAFLKRCREEAQRAGVRDVRLSTLVSCVGGSSDLGRHLCEHAAAVNADLVITGSRGMGAAQRAVLGVFGLGSVSDYVLKHAQVPGVLVHKSGPARGDGEA
jgi:nucleotide-binding universal stress UspA family protein